MSQFLNQAGQQISYLGRLMVLHQDAVMGVAAAAAVLLQTVLLMWVLRRVGRLAGEADRLRHLTEGLALLTDTTEAGLTTLIREVERLGLAPRPGRASRKSVARRVVAAADQGDAVAEIAGREAMSESEVRLHLMLANVQARKATATRASAGLS
jgi:hypothetical protein